MAKAALIYNPQAGRWRTLRLVGSIRRTLQDGGYDLEPCPTIRPGQAGELARRAAADGAEVVFVFGGDGTLREAAAGLLGTVTALAPIPGGTANVVALALGLPADPQRAACSLLGAPRMQMDVGLCGREIFLMQTSAGLDARIMSRLDTAAKRRFGKAAVIWEGLRQWSSYDYPPIELLADGQSLSASFAAICNLPFYAGSWQMAPGASTHDRSLDLVLFRGEGRRATLGFAADFLRGRHIYRQDVELKRVETVELCAPRDLPIQLDGDALPLVPPLLIRVASQRLVVLSPRSAATADSAPSTLTR